MYFSLSKPVSALAWQLAGWLLGTHAESSTCDPFQISLCRPAKLEVATVVPTSVFDRIHFEVVAIVMTPQQITVATFRWKVVTVVCWGLITVSTTLKWIA